MLEEVQPRIMETNITVDGWDSLDAYMLEMACSVLHHIVAQPKIIPYTDMVKWVINEANILDRKFRTRSQGPSDLAPWTIYGLCTTYHSHKSYTTGNSWNFFLKRIATQRIAPVPSRIMKKRSRKTKVVCTLLSICPPYSFVVAMLFRLFGRPDSTILPKLVVVNWSSH